jgi:hypothetical protein
MSDKLPEDVFTKRAILRLRGERYKGIHTRYSGFNEAWREFYNTDPVAGVNRLMKAGVISGHPAKGGFTIYLPEDAPAKVPKMVLSKILAE